MSSFVSGQSAGVRRCALACLVLLVLGAGLRIAYVRSGPVPFTCDASYYTMVARNLYHGRGLVSDYVWNYLTGIPESLPMPAHNYWRPAVSVLTAGAFALVGADTDRAAQLPAIVFSSLLVPLTAWIAWRLFGRLDAAVLAAVFTALSLRLVATAAYVETLAPAAFFVNLTLFALWLGRRGSPLAAAGAGAAAGLASLTRNDGILLLGVALVLGVWLFRRDRRGAVVSAAWFAAAFVAVCLPWWVRQTLAFGSPAGGEALRAVFFTRLDDVMQLHPARLDLLHYLSSGGTTLLGARARAFAHVAAVFSHAVGPVGLVALVELASRSARAALAPWLLYVAFAAIAPPLLVPETTLSGGFERLVPGLLPVVYILAARVPFELQRVLTGNGGPIRRVAPHALVLVCIAALGYQWREAPEQLRAHGERHYPAAAQTAVEELPSGQSAVLADSAWLFYDATRLPCAQFPSDGPEAALEVAERLGIRFFVTTGFSLRRVPAIRRVPDHPRFEIVAHYPDQVLEGVYVYRIAPETGGRDSSSPQTLGRGSEPSFAAWSSNWPRAGRKRRVVAYTTEGGGRQWLKPSIHRGESGAEARDCRVWPGSARSCSWSRSASGWPTPSPSRCLCRRMPPTT